MNEKIIQIAVSAGGDDNLCDILYALTNAGHVYFLVEANREDRGTEWVELPLLPGATEE